jgi:DHA2 family multidrug resistance protein
MTAPPTPAAPAPLPDRKKVFFGYALGAHLLAYDNTMVAIALPRMQGPMSATFDEITWALAAYLIAVAITLPLIGPLADRFGRKNVYLITVGGFAAMTVLASTSDTLLQLVAYRFVQGMFGASFHPLAQSFVFESYSPKERGQAMGWLTVGLTSGLATGPIVGGYFTEYFSWQAAFLASLPASVLSFMIVAAFARSRPNPAATRRFNVEGYVILATVLVALQFVLSRGERLDWFASPQIVIALCVSGVALYLFVAHTVTAAMPFIEPAVFGDRNFVIGSVLFFVMGVYWLGTITLASPFLQTLTGFPVVTAGGIVATQGVINGVAGLVAGQVVRYVTPPLVLAAGASMLAASTAYFSILTPDVGYWGVIFALGLGGVGMGFYIVPLAVIAFSTLPAHHLNVGAGLFTLGRNFGSSIAAAAVAAYLVRQTQANRAILIEHITPFSESFRHIALPDAWNLADLASLAALEAEVTRQASLLAYIDDFRWLTAFIVASIPLLLFVRMPR